MLGISLRSAPRLFFFRHMSRVTCPAFSGYPWCLRQLSLSLGPGHPVKFGRSARASCPGKSNEFPTDFFSLRALWEGDRDRLNRPYAFFGLVHRWRSRLSLRPAPATGLRQPRQPAKDGASKILLVASHEGFEHGCGAMKGEWRRTDCRRRERTTTLKEESHGQPSCP